MNITYGYNRCGYLAKAAKSHDLAKSGQSVQLQSHSWELATAKRVDSQLAEFQQHYMEVTFILYYFNSPSCCVSMDLFNVTKDM